MSVESARIIVVLGMHRSGTSAITRALEVLDVRLGDNLMPPVEGNNDKGFFEDLDIHELNTDLLSDLGSSWDRLEPLDHDRFDGLLPTYRQRAMALLGAKLQSGRVFAFKDPQTSLLLPFWQPVMDAMGVRADYLICQRNPLSVAQSLRRRDQFDQIRGYLLWAKYQLAAVQHTTNLPRLVVDYDALMDQPEEQLRRIAKAFALTMPEAHSPVLREFCREFLSSELRHGIHNLDQLATSAEVPPLVTELHRLLSDAAGDRRDCQLADFSQACLPFAGVLYSSPVLLDTIDRLDHQRLHMQQELDALGRQHAAITAECANAWAMHDQAQRDKQELGNEITNGLQREAELRAEIARIYGSHSWRFMAPFRGFRRHYRSPQRLVRLAVSKSTRGLWKWVPLSTRFKLGLKDRVFTSAGPLFGRTQAYRNWQSLKSGHTKPREAGNFPLKWIDEPVQNVKKLQGSAVAQTPVRLITFYLPQFHPIAENNEWWGEGFTEWTNVRPAQPQYEGHYQPHVPGDLGYYDLEDVEIQRRQVELAKLYGVGGFCFYFYWFGGKRLLENPILQYLENPQLDLPFCLCWANENWCRRWDGLDHEILIGQQHSAEDDLAFIAYVARYMRDPRYIRIDGRPLLLVYRPGLLPQPELTAERWRTWCRQNGLGEIYLAYTQSFDNAPPARFGFDAAVEFPPNATQPPAVTHKVTALHNDFSGQVFDWSIYLKRSAEYRRSDYKLFRGVCPSWDNTARRKNRSTSFINSSPRGYQEWLFNAIRDTQLNVRNEDERLVFINAWNEWAEGAHLEPDQRYGYGFLEATRMAGVRASLQQRGPTGVPRKLAVVVHAYYPDVFAQILEYLQKVRLIPLKLFVSCPSVHADLVRSALESNGQNFLLEVMPNHGRDVLPFLKLMPHVIAEGFEYLLKVHTKKSAHRSDGDVWRQDLYEKLLTERAMEEALTAFAKTSSTGILSPAGHLVSMTYYWGSNAQAVEKLACRLGIRPADLSRLNFAAGTMFFAQTRAIEPLLNLALDENDFEQEGGQVDGTMAHAVERAFSISALAAGLEVRSTGAAVLDYAFAKSTRLASIRDS